MSAGGASPNGPFPGTSGYFGTAWAYDGLTGFNALDFLIRQVIAKKAFAGLVKVLAVQSFGVAKPAVVSVQPMVNQTDGFGNQVPHGEVFNVPCFRLQSGVAAIVIDPVVGDVGLAVVCHRDHSVVKATGAVGAPGSFRQNSWADGMYFGSFLGPAATTYVGMDQEGNMSITATTMITVNAPTIVVPDAAVLQIYNLPTAMPSNPNQVWRSGTGDTGLNITAT